jgi:hypothetical protein
MVPNLQIIPIYFFATLFFSFFILYLLTPIPKIIVKHPDPTKTGSDLYVDDNGVCYKYKRVQVNCTTKDWI